jgi:hypothetical protein
MNVKTDSDISVSGRWSVCVYNADDKTEERAESIFVTQWCATENAALRIAEEWCRENGHVIN